MSRFTHSGSLYEEPSMCEAAHAELVRRAVVGGIVLLKNGGTLPLAESASAATLGYSADKIVKSRIGSGGVDNHRNISIYERMKAAGVKVVSRDRTVDC